jgi:hydroxymethylglutaryl-CoA lyase
MNPLAATLVDVSLRDGLQDEAVIVGTTAKADIAQALVKSGVKRIEATSFVHPRWVPQLADADELVALLPSGARYSALVLNERGWTRAKAAFDRAKIAAGDYDLVFVTSASPRHARSNNNASIDETLELFDTLARLSRDSNVFLRATIACAFGSPWDDEQVSAAGVISIAERFISGGVTMLTLADTVGHAQPFQVKRRIGEVRDAFPDISVALHLHDTSGFAIANTYAALESGVRTFEGALAGIGGCPFAPGATGNQDLAMLARFLSASGFETGLDVEQLSVTSELIRDTIARAAPARPALTSN